MLTEIEKNAEFLKQNRPKNRLMTMFSKTIKESQKNDRSFDQYWQLQFLSSPTKILTGKEGEIVGVEFEYNELLPCSEDPSNPLKAKAKGTGELCTIPCSLLIKCIGYDNVPISDSIPFDKKCGIVPNIHGRVIDPISSNGGSKLFMDGIYVAGWIKTGPVGVLTSTLYDASETARSVMEDFQRNPAAGEKKGIFWLFYLYIGLESLKIHSHWITFQDWLKVDKEERKRGIALGKEREKITNNKEMLLLAKS
jgi:adrenodoxin-NADP+ reductase